MPFSGCERVAWRLEPVLAFCLEPVALRFEAPPAF
jgi:hypothetical protein